MTLEELNDLIRLAERVRALHKNRLYISTDDIGLFPKLADELARIVIMKCERDVENTGDSQ